MEVKTIKRYWPRMAMASGAAFVLVAACSISMQPYQLKDPESVGIVFLGVLIFAVPCGAVSALLFKRNDFSLILGSQVLTIVALASYFLARA